MMEVSETRMDEARPEKARGGENLIRWMGYCCVRGRKVGGRTCSLVLLRWSVCFWHAR